MRDTAIVLLLLLTTVMSVLWLERQVVAESRSIQLRVQAVDLRKARATRYRLERQLAQCHCYR